jgi:hypothetical protein
VSDELKLSRFQQRVLQVPESIDAALLGGRGGGKSYALVLLALRFAEQYREEARILLVRQSYPSLRDIEATCREVFALAYGPAASYNAGTHVWTLPNHAYFELSQLESESDTAKFQGRSFNLLLVDEAGQWPTPDLIDRLRANLRGPAQVPKRVVLAANPGGPGHAWVAKRFAFRAEPWKPFKESQTGREFVRCPSTFLDNPYMDQAEYEAQLAASCASDPELLRAWRDGDWSVARGAFFSSCIDEARNAFGPWTPEQFYAAAREPSVAFDHSRFDHLGARVEPMPVKLDLFLAHDYGSSAPSVTYVCARSPGFRSPDDRYYPRGSILLLAELATNTPDSATQGLGWTIEKLSEAILALCRDWSIEPCGFADDAIFARHGHTAGSVANEFSRCGVFFSPAGKGNRVAGWTRMRSMLAAAGEQGVPGLYVSRACEYWWQTVPVLPRDPRRIEDVDSRGPDHAADACRYALDGAAGGASVVVQDLPW